MPVGLMRAIRCHGTEGPDGLRLEEVAAPTPGPGQVGIRVTAAGVNFADTLMVRGKYQERPSLPFTPGLELAGTVEQADPAGGGPAIGTRVMAPVDHGAFAEMALARTVDVVPLPDHMDDATAAGFVIAYGTAIGALAGRAALQPGETLLIHGAAGGVGLTAVEVGKAIGARVIATARGADRLAVATFHGADAVLDSERPDLVAAIREAAGPNGIDVAFDPVGGPAFEASLRTIAREGRILVIGFASGKIPQIPANILLVKNAAAIGFYLGGWRRRDPARYRAESLRLLEWHRLGLLRPRVSHRLPLAEAAEALRLLESRAATGKVVLLIDR